MGRRARLWKEIFMNPVSTTPTARCSGSTQGPLSTLNLLRAGVPAREVIWFRGLKPGRQMAALGSWRGQLLLGCVRQAIGKPGA